MREVWEVVSEARAFDECLSPSTPDLVTGFRVAGCQRFGLARLQTWPELRGPFREHTPHKASGFTMVPCCDLSGHWLNPEEGSRRHAPFQWYIPSGFQSIVHTLHLHIIHMPIRLSLHCPCTCPGRSRTKQPPLLLLPPPVSSPRVARWL